MCYDLLYNKHNERIMILILKKYVQFITYLMKIYSGVGSEK